MPTPTFATLLKLADQGEVFHIVDTETTGLSPSTCRVIELATVSVRHGRVVDRFETLINPGVPVPAHITKLTGISQRMLVNAPGPEEAIARWLAYMGGQGQFVAHNANFDWGFLKAECDRASADWPFKRRFCTVQLSRHCLPDLGRHSLENLIRHFGIRVTDRHRALADVEATAEIFHRFLAHLRGEPMAPAPAPAGEDAWVQVLDYVRDRSVTAAAMLEQHAAAGAIAADGELVLTLTPVYRERLGRERAKLGLLKDAVRAVYGEQAYLTLAARQ